jgi:hypothetical protein
MAASLDPRLRRNSVRYPVNAGYTWMSILETTARSHRLAVTSVQRAGNLAQA